MMKKHLLTALFILGCMAVSLAQVPGAKATPVAVKNKFKSEYPSAVIKRWEVKPVVKEYVAVFVDQNLSKRARYKADGTPLFLHIHHPKAAVPATATSKVLAEYPGFTADWANEWKNFRNGNHFMEIRFSKPGYVLKAVVKPDGTVVTDKKQSEEAMKEAGESGDGNE